VTRAVIECGTLFLMAFWSTRETDSYYDAAGNVVKTQYSDLSFTQTLYSLYGQPIDSATLTSVGVTDAPSFTMPAGGVRLDAGRQ